MTIKASILKDKKVVELLNNFKQEPSIKILMAPINAMLKTKKSINAELELVCLQLILDIKKGKTDIFKAFEGIDIKALKTKLARAVSKPVIAKAIDAAELLQQSEDLESDMSTRLNAIREGFVDLIEGAKIKTTKENKKTSLKTYDNPSFKEVLVQFEANESIVYLLNLVSRAYAEDLFLLRANRCVAALEILASIREEDENPLIYFGKTNLDQIRNMMRGSVSLEIVDMCLGAVSALFERLGEVDGTTPELKNAVKNLKERFTIVKQKMKGM
jgi:hypothetical protein